MRLKFCSGARTVTGANYLMTLENGEQFLIDCGLLQGERFAEELNFEPFLYEPKTIKAVFITHAHIDHTGRLPKLLKDGFAGKIYSTPASKDFALLALADTENVLAKEAESLTREKIYSLEDVENLKLIWQGVDYYKSFEPIKNVKVTFFNAGHILGSSFILFEVREKSNLKKIVFSGDLGNSPNPILKPLDNLPLCDFTLVESAYGDRIHEDVKKRREKLYQIIETTILKGGTVVIPAFAIERSQEIIFEVESLIKQGRLPQIPIFLDSPLAIRATQIYEKYHADFNQTAQNFSKKGRELFNFKNLKMTLTKEESKTINNITGPKVIIAGSGMSQGGRVVHHELRYLADPNSTILIVGYQAQGSLGRKLLQGLKEAEILGQKIPVKARIKAIGGYSAHADQKEIISWLSQEKSSLKEVFVVQGEAEPSQVLAKKINQELNLKTCLPEIGQEVEL